MLTQPSSIPAEVRSPAEQTIGESGLAHHLDLYDRLMVRRAEASAYYSILEEVLGFSLREAVISTSEHAAPFNFPSSVSYALPQLAIQHAKLRPPARIIILIGTLVPFDNRHYPRGFVLEDGSRFNLFSQRIRKSCPVLQPPVNAEPIKGSGPFFKTYPWLRPHLTGETAFRDAGDQMAAVMTAMAAKWFADLPCSVTIRSFEEVARQVLIRLLEARDPWLDSVLLDPLTRRSVSESLMGTFCAWGVKHGSFLFWNSRGDRLRRVVEQDQCLVDEDFSVPFTREALLDALTARTIVPGVFLSLMATSYLPGLAVAGGPKQPDYYRAMIRAANAVGGVSRGLELSTYGYWCVDLGRVSRNRTATKNIPKEGAGLSLTSGDCDAEWLCEQLATCPIIPIPPMPSYE